jgi:hypothetical protein
MWWRVRLIGVALLLTSVETAVVVYILVQWKFI